MQKVKSENLVQGILQIITFPQRTVGRNSRISDVTVPPVICQAVLAIPVVCISGRVNIRNISLPSSLEHLACSEVIKCSYFIVK